VKKVRFLLCVGTLMAAVGIIAPAAMAEATRTWVSGVGDDANPCSRTAPCKTFAGAISKTATNGEINVLDPGGFGGVTISKSLTIQGLPGASGVLVAGAGLNAIVVNAGASGRVVLRNLDVFGSGSANVGVRYLSGKSLVLDGMQISNFAGNGVGMPWAGTAGTDARLYVRHSEIDGNGGVGVAIAPTTAGTTARVSISDTVLDDNLTGLEALASPGAKRVSIRNCEVSGNSSSGIFAQEWMTNVTDCLIEGNGTGLLSAAGGQMRVSLSTITDNNVGVNPSGGQILSRSDNTLEDNVSNGAFSGTYGPH
jgi:hypothetical protein